MKRGCPGGSDGKVMCLQCRRPKFNPWVRKIPWKREWLPIPVFLPGEFHRQRSLAGYSPWGCKESDTTKWGRSSACMLSCLVWHLQLHLSGWTDMKHSDLSILIWYQQAQCQTFLFYWVGRSGEEERTSERIHRLNLDHQCWGLPPQWDSTALRQLTLIATSTDVHVPSIETGRSRFYNICTKERETSADLVPNL